MHLQNLSYYLTGWVGKAGRNDAEKPRVGWVQETEGRASHSCVLFDVLMFLAVPCLTHLRLKGIIGKLNTFDWYA